MCLGVLRPNSYCLKLTFELFLMNKILSDTNVLPRAKLY